MTEPKKRGRKPTGLETASASVFVRLKPSELARLKRLAAVLNVPPSTLAREAVLSMMDARVP